MCNTIIEEKLNQIKVLQEEVYEKCVKDGELMSVYQKSLFHISTLIRKTQQNHSYYSEIPYAIVLPSEAKNATQFELACIANAFNYDYYLMEKQSQPNQYFIHFTKPQHLEVILEKGINASDADSTSFGDGVYCYELTLENLTRLKSSVSDWTAVIFEVPIEYFECYIDKADGTHDGTGQYPPYCFVIGDVPAEQIMTSVRTYEDIEIFLASKYTVQSF